MIRVALLAIALMLSLAACSGPPPATPEPLPTYTPLPTATPYPTPEPLPTYTPFPTATPEPLPTYTPFPTATPYPTPEPLPTYTPLPTATPYPTPEPLPTYTPLPTATPYPTPEPLPTYTPLPTATPSSRQGNWVKSPLYSQGDSYTIINTGEAGPLIGPWAVSVECGASGKAGAFIKVIGGDVFVDTPAFETGVLVDIDGAVQERSWSYFPSEGSLTGYLSATWASNLIKRLLTGKKMTLTIPTSGGDDYVVTFDVRGLRQYIQSPADVCK